MASIGWGSGSGADTELAWADNCSLSSTRIVSAAIELAFDEPAVDGNTVALWRLNDGAGDTVLDATANGNNLTKQAIADWTAAGFLNGGISSDDYQSTYRLADGSMTVAADPEEGCIDGFVKPAFDPTSDLHEYGMFLMRGNGAGRNTAVTYTSFGGAPCIATYVGAGNVRIAVPVDFAQGEWSHIATMWKHSTGKCYTYINGVQRVSSTYYYDATLYGTYMRMGGGAGLASNWAGEMDSVRVSDVMRTGLPRTRYPDTGIVTGSNCATTGTVEEVSWGATTTGDNEGSVAKVEIYTAGAWTQAGDDNPTSPITGLSLPITEAAPVRVTMTPKADTLQTESPSLTWLMLEVASSETLYGPLQAADVRRVTMQASDVRAVRLDGEIRP